MTDRDRKSFATLCCLVVLVLAGAGLIFMVGRQGPSTNLSSRVRSVATGLRCPVCQGESVYDSPSGLAQSMRVVIRRQLRAGGTPAEVRSYFVHRYGQWILLAPPASGVGALVWFGPPLVLLVGLGMVGALAYHWSRRKSAGAVAGMDENLDPEDAGTRLERLEQLRDEGLLDGGEYRDRLRVLQASTAAHGANRRRTPKAAKRRIWAPVALSAAALMIAVTVSLAVQTRGSGPATGSIPNSGSPDSSRQIASAPPALMRAAQNVDSHPRNARAWVRLGSTMLTHRDYKGARLAFSRAIKLDGRNEGARLSLAFLEIGRRRYRAALRQVDIVKRIDPTSPRLWLIEGMASARVRGGHGQAIEAWKHFLVLNPHSPFAPAVRTWMTRLQHGSAAP